MKFVRQRWPERSGGETEHTQRTSWASRPNETQSDTTVLFPRIKRTNLAGLVELALSVATDLAGVAAEGDGILVHQNVGNVLLGALEGHAADSHGSLPSVLKVA